MIKMEDMQKNEIQLLEMKNTIYEKIFKSLQNLNSKLDAVEDC